MITEAEVAAVAVTNGRPPASALRLLADADHRHLLAALAYEHLVQLPGGKLVQLDHKRMFADAPDRKWRERLCRLERVGVVRRCTRVPRCRECTCAWELTVGGRELVNIAKTAQLLICGVRAIGDSEAPVRECPMDDVLRALSDTHLLRVVRALADGPQRPVEVERLVGLGHRTVHGRLARLRRDGVCRRRSLATMPRAVADELELSWRRLAGLVLLAVRWELRWGRPRDPALASDLAGLLEVVAPLARPARQLDGIYQFVNDVPASAYPRFFVEVADGTLRVCDQSPAEAARATVRGDALGWCETLIRGRPVGVEIAGDAPVAARGLIAAVTDALFTGLPRRTTPSDAAGE